MNKFWKVYFWICLIFTISIAIYYSITGTLTARVPTYLNTPLVRICMYVVMFIPVVAIHGLAFRKKYLHHIFWKVYFVWYAHLALKNLVQVEEAGYSISIFVSFQIVTLIGFFIYSFRQNKLFGSVK